MFATSLFSILLSTPISGVVPAPAGSDLVVHEWGTFTTVVDPSGAEVSWNAFQATEPLPPFVHTPKYARKKNGWARVRMETPVIYFHTEQDIDVDLEVEFRGGRFSEWYPHAEGLPAEGKQDRFAVTDGPTRLIWNGLKVSRDHNDILPTTLRGAHYFAARGVAAATVRMPVTENSWEAEKFLFYRGLGDFDTPLTARIEGDRVRVENRCDWQVDQVMVFRRQGDQFFYDIKCYLAPGGSHDFDLSKAEWSDGLRLDDLKKILRGQGLYEDEAQAMVDTWRNDWFGQGLRVLYTVPAETTDEILPLTMSPTPTELRRVLVGRVELITPELHAEVANAASKVTSDEQAASTVRDLRDRYGRIAPIALSMHMDGKRDPLLAAAAWRLIAAWQ